MTGQNEGVEGHLLQHGHADRAFREVMPILEHLSTHDSAKHDGLPGLARDSLERAVDAFRRLPEGSAALTAFVNWLRQNTDAVEAVRHEGR